MSHAIPFALQGTPETQAPTAPVAPPTQPMPLASAPITSIAQAKTVLASKPPHARAAGDEWSWAELRLLESSFKTAGLAAAYNAIPHRTKPAVRGRLQRAGLIPRRARTSATANP